MVGSFTRSTSSQHYSFTMLYLSAGNTRRNRQNYSSILPPPQAPALILTETGSPRSASGPTPSFCPPILDLVFDHHTNYFMGTSLELPDSDDGHGDQSFGAADGDAAAAAAVTEESIFTNTGGIRIDTDVPLNPRRRKRMSPVTPLSLYPGHSSHESSVRHPGVFDGFGPLPMDLTISPSLAPSHQLRPSRSHSHSRSRSASQNLHPPQIDSSRNPSPRPSTSGLARSDLSNHGTETTEPPPKKKRRRQALSCTECKRRKIRCDRVQPCAPCNKRGEGDKCRWHILEPV